MRARVPALPPALTASLGLAVLPAGGVAKKSVTTTVKLKDDLCSPTSKTVKHDSTVVFKRTRRARYNVVVEKGPVTFSSRTQTRGTYRRKLTRKGTYMIDPCIGLKVT